MGWTQCISNNGGGGGSGWSKTLLASNSAQGSTLSLSDDFHNYDLIEFVCKSPESGNPSYGLTYRYLTTPDILDSMFTYSNNTICLNIINTNYYVCYTKSSNTSFAQANNRSLICIAVNGFKYSGTVTKDTLYERQGIGGSDVAISSQDSLFDYDLILFSTNTADNTETVICTNPVYKSEDYNPKLNRYNSAQNCTVSQNAITSYRYFCVQGLKFT